MSDKRSAIAGFMPSRTRLYQPLDPSRDSIRLLKVEPGSESDQIRCQLIHVTFASKPQYEALSYTWGPSNDLRTILVDSHRVMVRRNLYWALFNIRDKTEERLIWADAVCINQDDLDERNRQVSLMTFTFSRAQAVLVWLGYEGDDRDERASRDDRHVIMRYAPNWQLPQFFLTRNEEADWQRIYTWLSTRDYWNRVWIVQEIALARKIYCFWEHRAPGLVRAKEEWNVFVEQLEVHAGATARLPLKLSRHRSRRYGNMNQLEHLLANFADAQCAEPRDKVYGLLGLAHGSQEGSVEVDYSKSLFDLYVDLVTFHHLAKALDEPLPPNIDRSMRLVSFSQLVQQLFKGSIEDDIQDGATRHTYESLCASGKLARGLIEGVIIHLGPSYSSTISSFEATRRWKTSLDQYYHSSHDLSLLRELDDAYTTAILEMEEKDLAKICEITSTTFFEGTDANASASDTTWKHCEEISKGDPRSFGHWKGNGMVNHKTTVEKSGRAATGFDGSTLPAPTEPRRFLASNLTMGLAPPEAREGDLICRFWDCDVAAVLRLTPSEDGFQIIGRADVATGWAITEKQPITINKTDAFEVGGGVVMVVLDIPTLQKLTR